MTTPRLAVDLTKIERNARALVKRLAQSGIDVMGVTKVGQGDPRLAAALLTGGVSGLGDSHVGNLKRLQKAGIQSKLSLIRSPMLSQADDVVRYCDLSFNSELDVIHALSIAALKSNTTHGVVLMVELGDLREGILAGDLLETVAKTLRFPNIRFEGIGTNLACINGITPDVWNMGELSDLADAIDARFGAVTHIVSGGNSANLNWALGDNDTGRVNNLRLGEAILFGRESLLRHPIDGLHTDAISMLAEVIEVKKKPSLPWGERAQNAFGERPHLADTGVRFRTIVAVGQHETDPAGLTPPLGFEIVGSSSDHLVLSSKTAKLAVGDEIAFQLNYSAFLRSMTSHMAWADDTEEEPELRQNRGSETLPHAPLR